MFKQLKWWYYIDTAQLHLKPWFPFYQFRLLVQDPPKLIFEYFSMDVTSCQPSAMTELNKAPVGRPWYKRIHWYD